MTFLLQFLFQNCADFTNVYLVQVINKIIFNPTKRFTFNEQFADCSASCTIFHTHIFPHTHTHMSCTQYALCGRHLLPLHHISHCPLFIECIASSHTTSNKPASTMCISGSRLAYTQKRALFDRTCCEALRREMQQHNCVVFFRVRLRQIDL